jgi:hypothetical protein
MHQPLAAAPRKKLPGAGRRSDATDPRLAELRYRSQPLIAVNPKRHI